MPAVIGGRCADNHPGIFAAIGGRCDRIGVVLVVRRQCRGSCLVGTLGLSGAVRVYQACSSRRDMGVRWHIPQAERSKGPILVWLPDPEAISLVTFFFARKESYRGCGAA